MHRSLSGATRVGAANGGATLAALRVNHSYEKRKAGEIVRDLAGEVGIDTGSIEAGPHFPFYVVDDGRSAWTHVADLAAKSGFVARFDGDGALVFGPPSAGAPAQTFTYGRTCSRSTRRRRRRRPAPSRSSARAPPARRATTPGAGS